MHVRGAHKGLVLRFYVKFNAIARIIVSTINYGKINYESLRTLCRLYNLVSIKLLPKMFIRFSIRFRV